MEIKNIRILIIEKKDCPIHQFTKKDKIEYVSWEIYRELYKNSTPSANFDLLYMTAKRDSRGTKEIKYWNYYIERQKCDDIIEKVCKVYKLKRREIESIKGYIYLGCSPKFYS
jgi:hypothetical protein